jgi:sarcosine oxidase delta subunit
MIYCGHYAGKRTDNGEREELVNHINRCRELLAVTRDTHHRKTLIDLLAYLEAKIGAVGRRGGDAQGVSR